MDIINDQLEAQQFIKNLSGKSKFSISKNSRMIGLSRQTYQNKLNRLRDQKIITNFTININPDIRPNNLKYVMIEIKTNPKEPELVKELLEIPQLRLLDGIIGEFSLFALLIFKSPEEYYQILNTIDNIMAKSYFKKYQIIDTIKIFKTNGISLRKLKMTLKEELIEKLNNFESERIELEFQEKIDLNLIAKKYADIEYDPKKFPSLIIRIEDFNVIILIFSNGKIVITGLTNKTNNEQLINKVIERLMKIGIKLDKKKSDQNYEIDYTDSLILNILQNLQGFKPISTYDISKIFKKQMKMDISQSTIHNRIKNLEQKGIILNYTVNFNPKKVGFEGKYLLRIKPKDPSKYDHLALNLEQNKHITDLFRIGEQYGLFAIIRVNNVEDYANFIREMYETEEIEDTFTNFVLDELITYTNFMLY